jgi:hypothetical protein
MTGPADRKGIRGSEDERHRPYRGENEDNRAALGARFYHANGVGVTGGVRI